MENQVTSVMIVGVGGQGTLLASRLLGTAMMQLGHDVKVSEVHGMSQRGGSVVTLLCPLRGHVYLPLSTKAAQILFWRLNSSKPQGFCPT